jgi:hypothetical protein
MKKAVFWDVTPCRYGVHRRSSETSHVSHGRFARRLPYNFPYTLKMEAIRSSETSVNTISTRCHIPEDCFLHMLEGVLLRITLCVRTKLEQVIIVEFR